MAIAERAPRPAERLIFAPSVEALLVRGVGDRITPELRAQLKALGIDLDKPLLPAYPLQAWMASLELVARTLYPGVPMGEAQLQLGRSTVAGWEDTLAGRAMYAVARLYGTKRVLMRYPAMARASNNYLSMEAVDLGATEVELVCEPFFGWPEYFQGNLQALVALSGAKAPHVLVRRPDPERDQLAASIRWSL